MPDNKTIETLDAKTAWLDSLEMPTKRYYRLWIIRFEEFTGLTADEIVKDARMRAREPDDEGGYWEAKIVAFKAWLINTHEPKICDNSATGGAMSIRGFFSYHRIPLKFRKSESRKISEKSRKTEDYLFSLAEVKKMAEVGNLEERYILLAGKSFGLRASDFLKLTRSNLETRINDEPPCSIGRIETQKRHVPAYPFIDIDAHPVVKAILDLRARQGFTKPDDRILRFKNELELSRALKRLADRAGLQVGSKIVCFRSLRKFLCDRLSSHMSESKWKLIVGKHVSESAYISAESLREDYLRAMPETTFTKNFVNIEERVKAIEDLKKQMDPETLKRINELGIQLRDSSGGGKRIEKLLRDQEDDDERQRRKQKCPKGSGKCQKIVDEANLGDLLAEGWKVVATLPSGKIVISNEV